MKKWTKEDIDNLYNLHKQGKDFKEISILLNRSHISVDKKCQRLGLKSNYNGIKYKHDYKYTTYNWNLIQKEYDDGLTYRDISNKFNLTPQSISLAITNNNLKLRTSKEGIKLAWKNGKYKIKNDGIIRYRELCEFKFNLKDYPNEFDFSLIEKYGWYKPTNKGNNLKGVSRDHIISIKFGFINNIDPKIISHPANCQLLKHTNNSIKKDKSDLTLSELLNKIEKWNIKYNKDVSL